MNGTFVTFEGVDGSGKSTLMERVAETLRQTHPNLVTTFEPGDTPLGKVIRSNVLLAQSDPVTELLLFAADRADHVRRVVRPALIDGKIVLCDRFDGSTVAYQGTWRGLGERAVKETSEFAAGGVRPHLTFWVSVSREVAALRRSTPVNQMDVAASDAYEELNGSFERQWEASPDTWVRIDGEAPLEEQVATVCARIEEEHEARQARRKLIVLVGPSGSGKNTLVDILLQRGDVRYALSATTRPKRPSETDGVDYRFVTRTEFSRMEEEGLLLETAEYAGHMYGTLTSTLLERDEQHILAVLELEGARELRRQQPDAVVVFLLVDQELLAERLHHRNSETPEETAVRMRASRHELRTGPLYADVVLDASDLNGMLITLERLLGK